MAISFGEKCSVQIGQSPALLTIVGFESSSFDARELRRPSTLFASHNTTSSRRFLATVALFVKGEEGESEGLLVYTCRSSELKACCSPSAARSTAASSGIKLAPKVSGLKFIVEVEPPFSNDWRAGPSNTTWTFEGATSSLQGVSLSDHAGKVNTVYEPSFLGLYVLLGTSECIDFMDTRL